MAAHLTDEFMTELLEGQGLPKQQAHLDACEECGARLEQARAALELALQAEVPEPPGLYWQVLRRNLSRRIAEEPRRRLGWGWLIPVAATVGALVVALSLGGRPSGPGGAAQALPAWSALPPVEEDVNLVVVRGFALEDDQLAEWDEGRGLSAFIAALSDEESAALVEALRVERREGDL